MARPLPNIRGGNDPQRAALLNALSVGRGAVPQGPPSRGPMPQGRPTQPIGSPQPGMVPGGPAGVAPVSFGDHLAEALKAFQGTEEDLNNLFQFFEVFKEVAQPFSQGSPSPQGVPGGPAPTMGFGPTATQSAQAAPSLKGPRGY